MPQTPKPTEKPVIQSPIDLGQYPGEAFLFVHEGLDFTVTRTHGPENISGKTKAKSSRHVNGHQLCQGLGELAKARWGRMARTVLAKWNITSTLDFGRIVYSMIELGQMQKVEEDSIEDFKDVYDFKAVFETGYVIPPGQS
jgi:uncharacterized repeat protein (TIGR04138 family)